MVSSKASTPAEYLKELSADRRKVISAVRAVIRKNLPKGYQEKMNWGMICYEVPLKRYPDTYNGQPLAYAALAAQKNYYAVYLSTVYQNAKDEKRLRDAFRAAGKKLDIGKSCVRFRKLEDLPLDVIGEIIAGTPVDEFIQIFETAWKR